MCAFPTALCDRFINSNRSSSEPLTSPQLPGDRFSSMARPSKGSKRNASTSVSDPLSVRSSQNNTLSNESRESPSLLSRDLSSSGGANIVANGSHPLNLNGHRQSNGVSHGDKHNHGQSPAFATADGDSAYHSPLEGLTRSLSQQLGQSVYDEFFDAADEHFSEYMSDDESARSQVSGRSPSRNTYRDMAARLHEEVTRRIAAEEALSSERQRREELVGFLTSVGASLPPGFAVPVKNGLTGGSQPDVLEQNDREGGQHSGAEAVATREIAGALDQASKESAGIEEEMSELLVARMVAEAVARGVAAASAEEELEKVLAQKEKELSRLRDKMLFWERMNEELSNQAQENMEIQRTRRRRRQRLQKVALASLGVMLGIGISAAVAYAFYPWESSPSDISSVSGVSDVVEGSAAIASTPVEASAVDLGATALSE